MEVNQKVSIKQIVAFSVLMENGDGILSKSQDYIMEKFRACLSTEEYLKGLLDNGNAAKFDQWQKTWLRIQ